MSSGDPANVPVKSVETTFAIVEALQEANGGDLTALADRVGRSKSTVHNHLQTLERHGYVVRDDGRYRLGLKFLDHGGHARARTPSAHLIRPKIRDIAESTEEICQFVVEQAGTGIVLFQERGDDAVETQTRIGTSVPLNGIAGGKALLAYLPAERVDRILSERGLPALTEATITDREELLDRLDDVRDRGYAINASEHIRGMRAISVPIRTTEGDLLGAVSVAGPSYRLEETDHRRSIVDNLLSVANELELNVTYSRF
jgi:DNA-binding IclR family transcriptional regulator